LARIGMAWIRILCALDRDQDDHLDEVACRSQPDTDDGPIGPLAAAKA
jgi:hypothetical protein